MAAVLEVPSVAEELHRLRADFQLEVRRLQAEVESLKEKLEEKNKEKKEEKEVKKKRDVFTSKKGFSDVPHFNGKLEQFDDWKFKARTFFCLLYTSDAADE